MLIFISRKNILVAFLFFIVLFLLINIPKIHSPISETVANPEIENIVNGLFTIRNRALLLQNKYLLESIYNLNLKYSLWAYEHELKKMKYLEQWSRKQGVNFTEIDSIIKIRSVREGKNKITLNLIASTEYKYHYLDQPKVINTMRIGTYHSMDIERNDYSWYIAREWYTDPFADSLHLDEIKSEEITSYIDSQTSRDFSNLSQRRKDAIEYMDRYCGAAGNEEYGFSYNPKYRNYNSLGGDCTNFASQVLHEGGKFRKTSAWNYDKSGATRAWVNAQAFKNYLLYSGRGTCIAYGTYDKVYKAAYKLLPGDIIAYEKEGKIAHISIVSGADSKGYTLVNSHNTDRYRVPWDLGWNDKGIRFWLINVHY